MTSHQVDEHYNLPIVLLQKIQRIELKLCNKSCNLSHKNTRTHTHTVFFYRENTHTIPMGSGVGYPTNFAINMRFLHGPFVGPHGSGHTVGGPSGPVGAPPGGENAWTWRLGWWFTTTGWRIWWGWWWRKASWRQGNKLGKTAKKIWKNEDASIFDMTISNKTRWLINVVDVDTIEGSLWKSMLEVFSCGWECDLNIKECVLTIGHQKHSASWKSGQFYFMGTGWKRLD